MQRNFLNRVLKRSTRNFSQHIYPDLHANGLSSGGLIVRSTTICCVRKGDKVVLMSDGQATIGSVVAKPNANKVRFLSNNSVICGFAGAAADGITLTELLEKKLEEYPAQLLRAAVEMAKLWRTEKILRHLNALMIVADSEVTLTLSGSGEVIESHSPVTAVGSGGNFAEAAGRALYEFDHLTADDIANRSMDIASDMCVYTNKCFRRVSLPNKAEVSTFEGEKGKIIEMEPAKH